MIVMSNETAPTSAETEAYGYLLNKIRHGQLAPGTRLRAEEIATEIGMSRMPVREALRRLDADGLVILRPNRGAIVANYGGAEISEMFAIRSVLEGLAVRLATPHCGPDQLEEMYALLARMTWAERDGERWVSRHWAFHHYVCSLSGATRLVREIERLHTLLEPYLRIWLTHVEKPIDATEDHRRLIEALATGQPDEAERAMRQHVLDTAPDVIAYLAAKPAHQQS